MCEVAFFKLYHLVKIENSCCEAELYQNLLECLAIGKEIAYNTLTCLYIDIIEKLCAFCTGQVLELRAVHLKFS